MNMATQKSLTEGLLNIMRNKQGYIVVHKYDTNTNASTRTITTVTQMENFLTCIAFVSHVHLEHCKCTHKQAKHDIIFACMHGNPCICITCEQCWHCICADIVFVIQPSEISVLTKDSGIFPSSHILFNKFFAFLLEWNTGQSGETCQLVQINSLSALLEMVELVSPL